MFLEYYLYYFYYTFIGFPFVIRVAVASITVFIPFFLIALFKFLQYRKRFYRKRKRREEFRHKFGDKISDIISSKNHYYIDNIEHIIQYNVKKLNKFEKRVLTNLILKIRKETAYINDSNYQRLIEYLQLRQFWEKKLKYGRLSYKQRALRKLDDLDIEIPGSVITSLTYNRNRYLRKRARSSYMYFSKHSPFKFFDEDFDKTFNDWDKIEIHRMLSRRTDITIPSLTQWIRNSKNVRFQCFLIDEIKYFDQKECAPYLLSMIDAADVEMKRHIIETLSEIKYNEAEQSFIKDYTLQPQVIQQSIIKAVQKLNTGNALSFLEDAYNTAHDKDSEIIILRAIYNYGQQGKKLFNELYEKSYGFSKIIFSHVSNPLIKYA